MGDASDGEEMPEQGEAKRARVDDGRDEEGGEQGGGSLTKKRKVALFFGYVGAGYAGFQRNPGVEAVEDVLERALHAAGGVSAHNLGDLSKLSWSRAARTDKGVSAVGQVVGVKARGGRESLTRTSLLTPPLIHARSWWWSRRALWTASTRRCPPT